MTSAWSSLSSRARGPAAGSSRRTCRRPPRTAEAQTTETSPRSPRGVTEEKPKKKDKAKKAKDKEDKKEPARETKRGEAGAKGDVEIQELTRLQQTVSRRMAESKATAPDFSIRSPST